MDTTARNPKEPYGSAANRPERGDTIFRLGQSYLVRDVRRVGHSAEIMIRRRGWIEWIPAGQVELIQYARPSDGGRRRLQTEAAPIAPEVAGYRAEIRSADGSLLGVTGRLEPTPEAAVAAAQRMRVWSRLTNVTVVPIAP